MATTKKSERPVKVNTRKGAKRKKRRSSKRCCFVISPFGGWNDRYYEEVYKPSVERVGLLPQRADDIYRPSAIVHDIWGYIKNSKVMLADVTGKNANVFYELGLAHAAGKPVVLITRSIDDVPFDLRHLRVIEYDVQDPEWSEILGAKIEQALQEVLEAPTLAVPPAFLDAKKGELAQAESPLGKQVLQLQEELRRVQRKMESSDSSDGPRIDPPEARSLIRRYLERGIPAGTIKERLMYLRVPPDWIDRQIHRYSRNLALRHRSNPRRKRHRR
ncbi:MAG TPA: hypothetical protein VKR82_16645 [Candidatus Acidoferrales bacterium]|nr:hypothetical protein [Candidatus Acidoferrales bacterium]